jgi:glycosyltransferase involved in cell wall biosynthesis
MKTKNHYITVCMPAYNASRYLRESIDSVLAQTYANFELIIVDDGSTDDSADIVGSYDDPRIRLIRNKHDYISSLNLAVNSATGDYIARMDADDVMMPDRLARQLAYLEQHPEVDVVGGNIQTFGTGKPRVTDLPQEVTMLHMIDSCALAHPTVMVRAEALRQLPGPYRSEYAYAEDYDLWIRMLQQGRKLRNLPDVVLKYRQSEQQISTAKSALQAQLTESLRRQACDWIVARDIELLEATPQVEPTSNAKLTVVIPFLNERAQVAATVKSIRDTAGEDVEIVVINDASAADYDYETALAPYGVRYYVNPHRLGAALSKERGVKLAPTPYFILIDAHMRFFTQGWARILTDAIARNPRRLYCCRTIPITEPTRGCITPDPTHKACRGAYLTFREDSLLPGIQWLENVTDRVAGLADDEICAVLGACYAAEKGYWQEITGMRGLLHFGSEEACISLKAWLEGGGCGYIPQIEIGHFYKTKQEFYVSDNAFVYNYLAIAEMLFPTADRCLAHCSARRRMPQAYAVAKQLLRANEAEIAYVRQRFAESTRKRFTAVVDLNVNACAVQHSMLEPTPALARSVANRLIGSAPRPALGPGFADGGAAGQLLFLVEYLELYPGESTAAATLTAEMFHQVAEAIEHQTADFSFRSGFSGIGWALLYLSGHRLLEDDLTPLLTQIDKIISQYSPHRILSDSFMEGIGGIFCYAVTRLATAGAHGFDANFLDELMQAAQETVNRSTDTKTCTYAAQLLRSSSCSDFAYATMRPMDVVSPSRFVPKNPNQWILDSPNVLGYAIESIYLSLNAVKHEEKPIQQSGQH